MIDAMFHDKGRGLVNLKPRTVSPAGENVKVSVIGEADDQRPGRREAVPIPFAGTLLYGLIAIGLEEFCGFAVLLVF